MPELLRSIASRLRELVGNRRYAPRYQVRVPVQITLLEKKAGAGNASSPTPRAAAALAAHTFDISATGVALVVPTIRVGERYLTGADRHLRILLELPSGAMVLHAAPARYERLEQADAKTAYLIGARITSIEAADRARLLAYLNELAKR